MLAAIVSLVCLQIIILIFLWANYKNSKKNKEYKNNAITFDISNISVFEEGDRVQVISLNHSGIAFNAYMHLKGTVTGIIENEYENNVSGYKIGYLPDFLHPMDLIKIEE